MPDGRETNPRRVLVAQSYFLRFDPKLWDAGQPVPPLGSLVFASVLRDRGFDVRFFDAMLATSEEDCAAALDRERPGVLVLFEDNFNYLTKMCLARMREAAARIIELARFRGVPVVVAGSDASDEPRFFLDAGATAVAVGEGETSIAEWLAASIEERGRIPGMVWKDETGALVTGPPRLPSTDGDGFPSPAWDLIDIAAYRRLWLKRHDHLSLPLATSRGCPFHCNWCAKPIWGQRYASMTPARAAREMALLGRLGATKANVVDDIFALQPGWMEAFGEELRKTGASLPFKSLSRADLLTDRMVRALAAAGCEMVWIGAESGSQRILDAMEKGTTVDEIRNATERLRSAGIRSGFFLQFGYPGETEADVQATWQLVEDALPDDIGISVSYPLPGTRFHARVKDEMLRGTHWYDSSDLAMLFRGRHDTRYYRSLHSYTHARFRLARALRAGDAGWLKRGARIVRYGLKRAVMGVALAIAGRDRIEFGSLAPELSRERAATPARGLAAPTEP